MPRRPRAGESPITREHAVAVSKNVGKQFGYAVAVHGSLVKDIDLIAVPWVSWAVAPKVLMEGIAAALPGMVHQQLAQQPHRRLACTILPRWRYPNDHWWIDLSMPRAPRSKPTHHKSERRQRRRPSG